MSPTDAAFVARALTELFAIPATRVKLPQPAPVADANGDMPDAPAPKYMVYAETEGDGSVFTSIRQLRDYLNPAE